MHQRLRLLEADGRAIRVAVVGAGQMGTGLVRQLANVPGLSVAGISDLIEERALAAAAAAGLSPEVVTSPDAVSALVEEGRTAVTTYGEWLARAPGVDAVVDATGDPEAGTRLALETIARRKPFVTMNIEADVTVGPVLAWMARNAGVVYTVAAGDEPAALCEMVDFARIIGFEVVCAGKGKNNRMDLTATARTVEAEAAARGVSPRMLAAFVDGTKTMAEMTALANATGLTLDCAGMHGPQANVADLLRTFVPEADGGILSRRGVVDYALGDAAPGVFLVVATGIETIQRDMSYLRMGDGPYYLFYRPYHLASMEAPVSVARAVLYQEVTMSALGAPAAECVAVAKRDLFPGEVLDGIGGEMVYGRSLTAQDAYRMEGLPIGVAQDARIVREVTRGTVLTSKHVVVDESKTVVQLRRLQEVLVRQGALEAR